MYFYEPPVSLDIYTYRLRPTNECYEEIREKYGITAFVVPEYFRDLMRKPFEDRLKDIVQVNFLLKSYELTMYIGDDAVIKQMKPFRIILLGGYLICWMYILFISIYYSDWVSILEEMNDLFRMLEEPFSGCILDENTYSHNEYLKGNI